jgi:hypothetical protein
MNTNSSATVNPITHDDTGAGGLLGRQWSAYRDAHCDRHNLLVHALTAPFFLIGSAAVVLTPVVGWIGLAGLALMIAVVALQGRAHRREPGPAATFAGPADFIARILAEQWVTFPRFVLSGRFAHAWRRAA